MSFLKETFASSIPMVDDHGRRYILNSLTKDCQDPWQKINELQSILSLPSVLNNISASKLNENSQTQFQFDCIFEFLDLMKCSRLNVAVDLFEDLKQKLDAFIQKFDEPKLLIFLKDTIQLISIRELKGIPISIIKRLKIIPPQYLDILAKKNFLSVHDGNNGCLINT